MFAFERPHDGVHDWLNVQVGQRALRMLKRQADRQTDLPFGNAFTLIPIEFPDAHER